jgi:hypothetical protein
VAYVTIVGPATITSAKNGNALASQWTVVTLNL